MVTCIVLAALACVLYRRGGGLRQGIVRAALWWATAASLVAEGLGAAGQLSTLPVALCWFGALVGLTWLDPRWPLAVRDAWRPVRGALARAPLLGGVMVAFVGVTLVVALLAAPNTWDSLTYHLPRIEQWIQNRTLAHYPTNVEQQIGLNPGAEILILHGRLLSGGDLYANVVQWLALVVGAVGVSLVAARLRASGTGQAVAALGVVTLPMAVLQASGTQNDLTTACWVILFVERVLALRAEPSPARAAEVGAAMGLALLTKGTAMLVAFPPGLWLLAVLARLGARRCLGYATVIGALAVVLNAGWWLRNYEVFHNPVGTVGQVVGNTRHTPGVVYANAVRNLASELATPSRAVNQHIHATAVALVSMAGLDPEDPATTLNPFRTSLDVTPWLRLVHEDFAANPAHTLVLIGAAVWVLWRGRADDRIFVAAVAAAIVLYCLVLRWQLWGTRLHVPVYLLALPLLGVAATTWRAATVRAVCVLMVAAGLPAVVLNSTRSLLPARGVDGPSLLRQSRSESLFANLPPVQASYESAADAIAKARPNGVGLILREGSLEYALWYLLRERGVTPRMSHLRVAFPVPDPLGPPVPDMFLAIDVEPDLPRLVTRFGAIEPVGRWDTVALYRRCPECPASTAR